MITVNSYITFNAALNSSTQRELLVKQARYEYGYGYGYGYDYGMGIDYFDVYGVDGDLVGFGAGTFNTVNQARYGYGYGYERVSDLEHRFIGVPVDEIWVTAAGDDVKIAFEDSNAIAAGNYFLITKSTTVGPIAINIKEAIYVQRVGSTNATVSILCTRKNKL